MRSKYLYLFLFSMGCGGAADAGTGGGGGGGGGPAELTVAEYGAKLTEATCAKAVGCCAPIELHYQFALADTPVTDEASCEAYLGTFLELEPLVRPSIESGRTRWDGARAAECVAALEALSCEAYSGRLTLLGDAPSGCTPFTGLVADGGSCGAPWECVSGYCDGVSTGVEGTCAPLPGAGSACPTGQCAEGLRCDFATSTCMERKADGEACSGDAECASNGCSEEQATPGVCNAPSICDGDLGDDQHEVYGTCSMADPAGPNLAIACRLGTSGQWECECAADGVESTCTAGSWDEIGDASPCDGWGCCGF